MAASYFGAGTAPTSGNTANGTNISTGTTIGPVDLPASVQAGDCLVLFVGIKPDTATVSTPTGWTLVNNTSGGGGTTGADTGPTRTVSFTRTATGGADDTPTVTLTSNNVAWAQTVVFRSSLTGATWNVTGAGGADSTTGTAWSVTCGSNPGITAGDMVVVGSTIPTDVTTPSQFTAEAVAATGVTGWSTFTEISEPDTSAGNDLGGFVFYGQATAGTATAAPVVTATAGGTTTNVRGTSSLVRVREIPPTAVVEASWARLTVPEAGAADPTGTASGAWAFTGTAAGESTRSGTASGSWVFTGAASGVAPGTGSATVEVSWAQLGLPNGAPVTPPTVTAGRARPVAHGSSVQLDSTTTGTIDTHTWAIQSGGGSLTGASTATPTYTPPASGTGAAVVRHTVSNSGGSASADLTVGYGPNIVAAENTLTGTARGTWDLPNGTLGGVSTLQGFADGFSFDKTETVNLKIAQSDTAGWTGTVYRLGYYGGNGARDYGPLTTTDVAGSQAQPAPGDADPNTTLLSADAGNWSVTATWVPPAWAPSGIYVTRLNRTGGGASHVMFVLRDDSRTADLMFMPADSTWQAYNAWGGMGGSQYTGNSLYYGTAVDQYNADCARFVSYNRPVVNRGAADSGRAYGACEYSNFFHGEYPMLRFVERNGIDVKFYSCLDAAGDATGSKLTGKVSAALFVGHNEYWSDGMRSGYEAFKAAGGSVFSCAGNEVFWRCVGTSASLDSAGRPRTWECYKSTIAARNSTGRTEWTGTWRDPDGAGKGGNHPENLLTGTIFVVNGPSWNTLQVPKTGGYADTPLWRNAAAIQALTAGQTWTSPAGILGFEWDTYGPAGVSTNAANYLAAPSATAIYCSTATHSIGSGLLLTDAGDVYDASGTATHRLVVTKSGSNGGITFGTGTIDWAAGVDNASTYHTAPANNADRTSVTIQQATLNMLVDMGATPATPMGTLTVSAPVSWYAEGIGGGTWGFTGTATGSAPPNSGTASGAWGFAGTASGVSTPQGTAAGTFTFTGTATGTTTRSGTATGAFGFAGTAAGESTRTGTSSGAWAFTGAAQGQSAREGTGTGAWQFAGTASGAAPVIGVSQGSASGAWSFTGAASGTAAKSGTAAGSFAFTGTAAGSTSKTGTASGTFAFTGTAAGAAPLLGVNQGTGAGTWQFLGTATGATSKSGTAAGGWQFTGVAVGSVGRSGTASGTWAFLGTAAGAAPGPAILFAGTATLTPAPVGTVTLHAAAVGTVTLTVVPVATVTLSPAEIGTVTVAAAQVATATPDPAPVGTATLAAQLVGTTT